MPKFTKDPQGLTIEDLAELKDLRMKGLKVNAIKVFRRINGCGLKEAKGVIDNWWKTGLPRGQYTAWDKIKVRIFKRQSL